MVVRKVHDNYEFEIPTVDAAFTVKLTITATGEERLSTTSVRVPTVLLAQDLEAGTIRMAIGEECWQKFVHMREEGFPTMFMDPHAAGVRSHKLTS
jgi:hypothetical protein